MQISVIVKFKGHIPFQNAPEEWVAPIAEPFADADAITDLVTGKSSPMDTAADPLVAAGPLDAVKVDEPRNNDF